MKSKTLFIIGAGAGKDIDVPTGSELAKDIAPLLNIQFEMGFQGISGGRLVFAALKHHSMQRRQDVNSYLHAGRIITSGVLLADSIDSFLDSHRDNPEIQVCGKIAIVVAILVAERNSKLYFDPMKLNQSGMSFEKIADTWFVKFFRMLSSGISKTQIGSLFDKVSIINFNYDRCVEHFLVHAIKAKYDVDLRAAQQLVSMLQILHPYGSIGPQPSAGGGGFAFGQEESHPELLLRSAQSIRTYTEQIEQADPVNSIERYMTEAETLVFLGFGYHRQNMDLLTPRSNNVPTHRTINVFGTARGLSDSDCHIVSQQIEGIVLRLATGARIEIKNRFGCSELFDQYRRSLSVE